MLKKVRREMQKLLRLQLNPKVPRQSVAKESVGKANAVKAKVVQTKKKHPNQKVSLRKPSVVKVNVVDLTWSRARCKSRALLKKTNK
jgi:hypothetical protein